MKTFCIAILTLDLGVRILTAVPAFEELRLAFEAAGSGYKEVKRIQPICINSECNKDRKPPRKPDAPTRPLTETGGWGFSYGPLPQQHPGTFPNDYMMANWMRGQWGTYGRNDLGMMHKMGAKMIRLYGNDPRSDATDFLNAANSWGLKVVAGISDYPYTEVNDNCRFHGLDCYKDIKESYKMNLESGKFLSGGGKYHPALDTLIIVNEPDLKFVAGNGPIPNYMKAILSAFDGILAAEKESGVEITSAENIKFTVAFSYAICDKCPNLSKLRDLGCCILCKHDDFQGAANDCNDLGDIGKPREEGGMRCTQPRQPDYKDDCPVLPMIMDLNTAMENPSSVGYEFKTQGWELAYKNRWVHSFNGFVPSDVMQKQFLDKYVELPFNKGKDVGKMIPVFMGEFGDPHMARDPSRLEADIKHARALVESKNNPFFAFNFFEFEVAYWKPCNDEEQWNQWQAQFWNDPLNGHPPDSCSERLFGTFSAGDMQVSKTGYVSNDRNNGPYPIFCMKPIFKGKPDAIASAFGGNPPDTSVCEAGNAAQPTQYCVAARGDSGLLGKAIEYVCGPEVDIDCQEGMPEVCLEDEYSKGDFILSKYFEIKKDTAIANGAKLYEVCDFGGAGVLTAIPGRPECVLTTVIGPPTVISTITSTTSGTAMATSSTATTVIAPTTNNIVWKIGGAIVTVFLVVVGLLVVTFALRRQRAARDQRLSMVQGVELRQ